MSIIKLKRCSGQFRQHRLDLDDNMIVIGGFLDHCFHCFVPIIYLIGRTQRVKIQNSVSTTASVSCGVPQGSILAQHSFTRPSQQRHCFDWEVVWIKHDGTEWNQVTLSSRKSTKLPLLILSKQYCLPEATYYKAFGLCDKQHTHVEWPYRYNLQESLR